MSLIATVQEQLQQVDELIAQLEFSISTEPRPSVAANIRALEKERRTLQQEFYRAAELAEMDVYRYRIINRGRATISGLTAAWREFQNMLNTFYSATKGTSAPKPKTKRGKSDGTLLHPLQSQLELGFGYSFHGSVGIAMTLPKDDAALFPDSDVERATGNIFDVVSAAGNPVMVNTIAKRLGPVPVQAVHRWVDIHVAHDFGVGIEWRRDARHHRSVTVQREEFALLKEELERTTTEATIQGIGELVIVNALENEFTIHMDDGTEIVGSYTGDVISIEQAAKVPARYGVTITKSTRVVSLGGDVVSETYLLKNLMEL